MTSTATKTDYDKQAQDFLHDNWLSISVVLVGNNPPPWSPEKDHGLLYLIVIQRQERNCTPRWVDPDAPGLTFRFWNSIDARKAGEHPTAYDVLACIISDANCIATFEEWCGDLGYDSDSLKDRETFLRCVSLARQLQEFFTDEELESLAKIQ